jgi:hypothetical protein
MPLIRSVLRSSVATWAKVGIAIVALDVVLFRAGLFWHLVPVLRGVHPTTWGLVYRIARELETTPAGTPTAVAVGSSVLFLGLDEDRARAGLRDAGVPGRLARFTTFGSSATDSALLAWRALRQEPWLVVYAAATRDFGKVAPVETPVARIFDDASADVPALAPRDAEQRLGRIVKSAWSLYRYRFFVRKAIAVPLRETADRLVHGPPPGVLARLTAAAAAEKPPLEALRRFHFTRITVASWAAWTRWHETQRFEDYLAWLRATDSPALQQYERQTWEHFGPDAGNRQVTSLAWMLDRLAARRTRTVVVFFPENPVFRAPGGERYYDPTLSQAYADLFAAAAAARGARFVDLRDFLPAEDFYDQIHPNLEGMRKLTARLVDLVAEEWHAGPGAAG